jgi:hypothetical protein
MTHDRTKLEDLSMETFVDDTFDEQTPSNQLEDSLNSSLSEEDDISSLNCSYSLLLLDSTTNATTPHQSRAASSPR